MCKSFLYICNFLDDKTRISRLINSDSPAASNKVLSTAECFKGTRTIPYILSIGRGSGLKNFKFYGLKVRKIKSFVVIYLPFIQFPFISELFSFFSLPFFLYCLSRKRSIKTFLFYNQMPVYLLGLLIARLQGQKIFLDLEDGLASDFFLKKIKFFFIASIFDKFCSNGVILSCSALGRFTKIKRKILHYGIYNNENSSQSFKKTKKCNILFSGSILPDTGANLIYKAIQILDMEKSSSNLIFHISGKGPLIDDFKGLSNLTQNTNVIVHGRIDNKGYLKLLESIDIGLSLKLINGSFSTTTFPSKIMEFINHGIVVIATRISDVQLVFGNSVFILKNNSPRELSMLILKIANNINYYKQNTVKTAKINLALLGKKHSSIKLSNFLFNEKN